jgi:hypothetical protein
MSDKGTAYGEIDPQEELERLLNEAKGNGEELANRGREVTEAGQELADIAETTLSVVRLVNPMPSTETLLSQFGVANDQAKKALELIKSENLHILSSASGTVTWATTDIVTYSALSPLVSPEVQPGLTIVIDEHRQVVERSANEAEVIGLMKSFGLDIPYEGKRSALDQFRTAHDAFRNPVGGDQPAITSLIPMREAMRETVDFLLKHRPTQEKARSEWAKIHSIGNQLGYDELQAELIDSWAEQWQAILDNDLHEAKQKDINREEWRRRLVRSTLFLKNLLKGLDPNKLRR